MDSGDSVLWRRAQGQLPLDNEPAWRGDPYSIPIPNYTLRESSSVGDLGPWLAIGEAWAHVVSHFLPPEPLVLDVGCGCGKLARFLYLNPGLRYIGVDLFLPAILWCRKNFEYLAKGRFEFVHFDGYSGLYNPKGTIPVSEYHLPASDGTVDMFVGASLFTHLLEPDCKHYLDEMRRVLAPRGKAVVSIHNEPPNGQRFSGDETRIDIEEDYFLELAEHARLACHQVVGNVYGQQVLVLERVS